MKYVPGLMVGQLSGKAGNTVASRNKAGSYMRTRVIPKHVVNAKTTGVRDSFGTNSQLFGSLQQAQRDAWNSLGAQMTRKTSLGETIHLTGLQALQSVNRNRNTLGQPPFSDAPEIVNPPPISGLSLHFAAGAPETTTVIAGATSATQNVTATGNMFVGAVLFFVSAGVFRTVASITDATHVVLNSPVTSTTAEDITWTGAPTISVDIDQDPIPADTWIIIDFTAPLSAGVSRPSRGQFRYVEGIGPTQTGPFDLGTQYVQNFGQPPAGSKVFCRAKFLSQEGFASPELQDFKIVS